MIERNIYLNRLINRMHNHSIKIVTGVRRCGKSVLVFDLFYKYLLSQGIDENHIITFAFDENKDLEQIGENLIDLAKENRKVDPHKFDNYIRSKILDDGQYYILLDEVQQLDCFEYVLNGYLHEPNLDVYVTGSNSRFLSSDVITEFRGRGDEVRVYPLSFKEFYSAIGGDKQDAYEEYRLYGGMPALLAKKTSQEKSEYLKHLINKVYLTDIVDRNKVFYKNELSSIVDFLFSNIGSLTNPKKISRTLKSISSTALSDITVQKYLGYLTDAFLFEPAKRYDIKGKRYLGSPLKYFAVDIGLRNAKLNFSQDEPNHIMENIIFNELKMRGYDVDVGVVDVYDNVEGEYKKKHLEIDFVVNQGNKRYYIQSAYRMNEEEKIKQEKRPLIKTNDSFKKIIIIDDRLQPRNDVNGIMTIGLINFLLDENSLDA